MVDESGDDELQPTEAIAAARSSCGDPVKVVGCSCWQLPSM